MRGRRHEITVCLPAGVETNAEGFSTQTFDEVTVLGAAATLGLQEAQVAASRGIVAQVAIEVPPATRVEPAAEVIVTGTGDLGLDGRYRVQELRPNRLIQRVLCARYELPEVGPVIPPIPVRTGWGEGPYGETPWGGT